MTNIPELFGCRVFNRTVMQARLPKETYATLSKTIDDGMPLGLEVANIVAGAMKDWAVELGATHYTHWFQPMTGITAEKHNSFISPTRDGRVIMDFSGKELVSGESDASSFPSGGLRATFEARGYTVWDATSFAFIKDDTLCIPTAFCSYSGEALDKKTPLLRSMDALNKQALRILRLFGNKKVKRVTATVGAEQEYFLIDNEVFLKRLELVVCGRTLFGAKPPKGQELDDHYFGTLTPRVSAYMKELDAELWKLGVTAHTKHGETAPAQYELASIYTTANIATDHNQLVMELMKSVANKHGLACLLHEKPFTGVNGSGKHNNWALATDSGANLLEPGDTPFENAQFLLFLVAVIKAADEYNDLLRLSAASAGNDHRLGGYEAPPSVISMFLGDELTQILEAIESGEQYNNHEQVLLEIGTTALPAFPKDNTDRNRTSPLAFTGNKFEFRMLGSAFSIAGPNIVINTAVADVLCGFADVLEKSTNFKVDLAALIKKTIKQHKRIIFNGNNYSADWATEAANRGLVSLNTTPDALPLFASQSSIAMFEKHCVFSANEIHSRLEIMLENYCKTIHIEALTMIGLVKKEILPSSLAYQKELAELLCAKKAHSTNCTPETTLLNKLSEATATLYERLQYLETELTNTNPNSGCEELAKHYKNVILEGMFKLREPADELETLTAKTHWSLPTYTELLYSVNYSELTSKCVREA